MFLKWKQAKQLTLTVVLFHTAMLSATVASARSLTELLFENGSGNIAFDSSGSGNDGAISGGAQFVADSPNNSSYSLQLDGIDDYIDLGALDPDGSALTLSLIHI